MDIDLIEYLLLIPAALITLSVHEYSHGYAAYRLGDPTARNFGRLTLNPLKHIDPIGAICMVLFRFGWAKPVPINARNFKNPRNGMAITAAAGPASNLFLAFLAAILMKLVSLLSSAVLLAVPVGAITYVQYFFYYLLLFFYLFHLLNLSLCIFNLIPLPPLDGSRILYVFLPPRLYFKIMRYERIIQIVLLIALWLGAFSGVIQGIVDWISNGMFWLLSFIS